MSARIKQFGPPEGLSFDLRPAADAGKGAYGALVARIGGTRAWPDPSVRDQDGVLWDWSDLLAHLAAIWPWLMTEEDDPLGLNPKYPHEIREKLGRRPIDDLADESLSAWQHRHDLASGLGGIFLPSIQIMRQGDLAMLSVGPFDHRQARGYLRPFAEVERTLSALGDQLAALVRRKSPEHAVLSAWSGRAHDHALAERIRAGRGAGPTLDAALAELDDPPRREAILAAARMTADLPEADRSTLLRLLSSLQALPCPELEKLSEPVASAVDAQAPAWLQGHRAARRLRELLGLRDGDAFDPARFLGDRGVRMLNVELNSDRVDAIAGWMPSGILGVIVNANGLHAQQLAGRRSTLAHEIGHLLLDRAGALPFVEVLGGHAPRFAEQRANAFAAELLFPEAVAADWLRARAHASKRLHALVSHFGVSQEVAGWQLLNGPANGWLTDAERRVAQRWTRAWR